MTFMGKIKSACALCCLLIASMHAFAQAAPSPSKTLAGSNAEAQIESYIKSSWRTLSRSMNECGSLIDTKVTNKPVLYLPADMQTPDAVRDTERRCGIRVVALPRKIEKVGDLNPAELEQQGLLFLPNPYVVPGGRFNEMYGWDSFFIILGLVRDGEVPLAKGMVDNFFFEIDHYGALLNANRTYFLTRSQPPLLSSMIMAVYEAEKSQKSDRAQWLATAYDHAVRDHNFWTREPHLAGTTGLSRYFDFGKGPVPEMGDDPHYYTEVATYLLTHPGAGTEYLDTRTSEKKQSAPVFELRLCTVQESSAPERCGPTQRVSLTQDYYVGDRSMRESGFDISFRFGPFSGSTHHYAPVCLNSLLYKYENDLAQMATLLGRSDEAHQWRTKAAERKTAMLKYLWSEKEQMFVDYDASKGEQSTYHYATAFYPLWAGVAEPEQAQAFIKRLSTFERAGGIVSSDRETGMQWDAPYGWAPLQWFAVEGLRRYHDTADADRLAEKFMSMVLENFSRDGTIREKYNLDTRSTQTAVTSGYKQNVVGFGWTNGVFLEFLSETHPRAAD
jgi:alpha,alpha-trehalase